MITQRQIINDILLATIGTLVFALVVSYLFPVEEGVTVWNWDKLTRFTR